jgi:hypothetical protein
MEYRSMLQSVQTGFSRHIPYDRYKTGDQMSEERFIEQVKNPVTRDFFQLPHLKAMI